MRATLHEGDCLDVLSYMLAESIDSCVTDPPYHLTTGKKGGTGFMNQKWDGGDIAFRLTLWREVLRVLKPGAYLVAFSGTRTYHRMVCAIEDAGFEIRDQLAWVYGQGFPKSHNLPGGLGTALKPAWEPIVLARKPFEQTVAVNVAQYGTGALNIDGCRLETKGKKFISPRGGIWKTDSDADAVLVDNSLGRWPANLCHDGSDDVVSLFPDSAGQLADESHSAPSEKTSGIYGAMKREKGLALAGTRRLDSGSAARFFYCAKATKRDRESGCDALPEKVLAMSNGAAAAAAARGEDYEKSGMGINSTKTRKNHHPTVKPTELMRWLCRLVTPAGGKILDPFMGSGSTGRAAMLEGMEFVGIEAQPEYVVIARARINEASVL